MWPAKDAACESCVDSMCAEETEACSASAECRDAYACLQSAEAPIDPGDMFRCRIGDWGTPARALLRCVETCSACGLGEDTSCVGQWDYPSVITGETLTIEIALADEDEDPVVGAQVRACFSDNPGCRPIEGTTAISDADGVVQIEGVSEGFDGFLEIFAAGFPRIARGRLSLQETAGILVHVASVAGAAHALGIVQRDLKPENIFLTHDADPLSRVRVLDFGIAKLAPASPTQSSPHARVRWWGRPATWRRSRPSAKGTSIIESTCGRWGSSPTKRSGGRPVEADNLGQFIKRLLSDAIVPLEEIVPDPRPTWQSSSGACWLAIAASAPSGSTRWSRCSAATPTVRYSPARRCAGTLPQRLRGALAESRC